MSALNATVGPAIASRCDHWPETRHFLLQGSHLCFAAAFLIPAVRSFLLCIALRIVLSVGFVCLGTWAAVRGCAGPDVIAWAAILLGVNAAQAAYAVWNSVPPRLSPELLELYVRVFVPLRVSRTHFKQLVRLAHIEPLEEGEHYAKEGVTGADQRLAVLLSGRMKVTCEDVLLHFLLPTEFLDSPEWESCATNTDKHFQVTLTATEHCRVLCWGRLELLALLEGNPFLKVLLDHLIGKDITHKLYSLNPCPPRLSVCESLDVWRTPLPLRSFSLDELQRMRAAEHGGDSPSSNFSDPGPTRKQMRIKSNETPV